MRRLLVAGVVALALSACASPQADLQDQVAEVTEAANAGDVQGLLSEATTLEALVDRLEDGGDLSEGEATRLRNAAVALQQRAGQVARATPPPQPQPTTAEPEPVETTQEPEPVETTPEPEPTPEPEETEEPEPTPEPEETEEPAPTATPDVDLPTQASESEGDAATASPVAARSPRPSASTGTGRSGSPAAVRSSPTPRVVGGTASAQSTAAPARA